MASQGPQAARGLPAVPTCHPSALQLSAAGLLGLCWCDMGSVHSHQSVAAPGGSSYRQVPHGPPLSPQLVSRVAP